MARLSTVGKTCCLGNNNTTLPKSISASPQQDVISKGTEVSDVLQWLRAEQSDRVRYHFPSGKIPLESKTKGSSRWVSQQYNIGKLQGKDGRSSSDVSISRGFHMSSNWDLFYDEITQDNQSYTGVDELTMAANTSLPVSPRKLSQKIPLPEPDILEIAEIELPISNESMSDWGDAIQKASCVIV